MWIERHAEAVRALLGISGCATARDVYRLADHLRAVIHVRYAALIVGYCWLRDDGVIVISLPYEERHSEHPWILLEELGHVLLSFGPESVAVRQLIPNSLREDRLIRFRERREEAEVKRWMRAFWFPPEVIFACRDDGELSALTGVPATCIALRRREVMGM